MHELSIAQSIVEIIEQHVPQDHGGKVQSVKLKVGALSGVVVESLEFCFSAVIAGTRFEGTLLDVERIDLTARCRRCNNVAPVSDNSFSCHACGSADVAIVSGRELQVIEIEITDNDRKEQ
jgi:hydrogenase nickel incorporation protein HypA/HybF